MVPFEIEIELNNIPVALQVEQLDYLADENGLMRYDVRGDLRHAVLSVNIEDDPGHPDFTFEAMQAEDESFTGDELLLIIRAIREFDAQARYPFNRLPFTH